MIISASRRTDIPAFYHEWFLNRVREGFLLTRNPFNAHQIRRISLLPQEVDVIVFWTRNPEKIAKALPGLDAAGLKYYFQYTITGYPRMLEKSTPNPHRAIEIFKSLSSQIGPGKIIWRYDPILISNQVDINEHKRLFNKIASLLQNKTRRVVISFADLYKKTERNLRAVQGLSYSDITKEKEQLLELSKFMSTCATNHGMEISSCSEAADLSEVGIRHGKCIDEKMIQEEFDIYLDPKKDSGQREECGCIKSVDIGEYNTCLHGCAYCYATFSHKHVETNRRKHNPNSPFLIDSPSEQGEQTIEIFRNTQTPLF